MLQVLIDVHGPIWIACIQFVIHDSNHLRATPVTPNDGFDKSKSLLWSMVSNAALRSSNIKMDSPTLSTA